MSVTGSANGVAILYRANEQMPVAYGVSGAITPETKMDALRRALSAAQHGDLITVGKGKFAVSDHGAADKGPIVIPPGVTLRGMGRGQTLLWSNKQIDADGATLADGSRAIALAPAFQLSDRAAIENMDVEAVCYNPGEDNGCIGVVPSAPCTVNVRNCSLKSGDWTTYVWSPGHNVTLTDCDIHGGRVLLANEDSGDGSDMTAIRCRLFGDASLSKSMGETSNRYNGGVFGCVARGGLTRIIDCSMELKGQDPNTANANGSFTPRVCGIVDRGGGNSESGRAVIEVYNLRCSISPNGADPARCFDMQLEFPYVQAAARVNWANCWGMSADGTLKRSW